MGGSTTVVTRFITSRAALINNVIRFIEARRTDELRAEVDTRSGTERIRALIRWSTRPTAANQLVRRLRLRALTTDDEGRPRQVVRGEARREHARIRSATTEAGHEQWAAGVVTSPFAATTSRPSRTPAAGPTVESQPTSNAS